MIQPRRAGSWIAAVSFNAKSIAMVLRETLIELDYDFEREKAEYKYAKIMFVVPLPNVAYVYQFQIKTEAPFFIETFDTCPSHSGILHMIAVREISPNNLDEVKRILQGVAGKLPRKPWQFFWTERFRTGLIKSEYLVARKRWEQMGVI